MKKIRDCTLDGHKIEIISIEEILQKIEKSIANLTEEQKAIMRVKLLQYEYDKLTDFLKCQPIIRLKLIKLRNRISKELKRLNLKNETNRDCNTRRI